MGTRAIITKDGKPFIYTHWDGYPSALGKELIKTKTDKEIVKIAKKHVIDAAKYTLCKELNKERFKHIAAKTKGKYTVKDLEKLHHEGRMIMFKITCADDYPISEIEHYGSGMARYQYDYTNKKWTFKCLDRYSTLSAESKELRPLTEEEIKKEG